MRLSPTLHLLLFAYAFPLFTLSVTFLYTFSFFVWLRTFWFPCSFLDTHRRFGALLRVHDDARRQHAHAKGELVRQLEKTLRRQELAAAAAYMFVFCSFRGTNGDGVPVQLRLIIGSGNAKEKYPAESHAVVEVRQVAFCFFIGCTCVPRGIAVITSSSCPASRAPPAAGRGAGAAPPTP